MALLNRSDLDGFDVDSRRLDAYLADADAELRRVAPSLADLSDDPRRASVKAIVRSAILRRSAAGAVGWEQRTLTKGPFADSIRLARGVDPTAIFVASELDALLELAGTGAAATSALPRGTFPAASKTGFW